MCGRFFVPEDDETALLRRILGELRERNIAVKTREVNPGDIAAVIANNRRLEPTAFGMHWGYRLPDGKLIFNARSETAASKPMFSDGIMQRRCLIPAKHYFEWQHNGKNKTKFAIAPQNSNSLLLAGIYRIEKNQPVFSVLTREPADSISFIHDRMPVILPNEAMSDWLNPKFNGIEVLRSAVLDVSSVQCG